MVYENISLHQRGKAYVYVSYAWCLWSIKNCHTLLLLDVLLKWNLWSFSRNTSVLFNNARSTVCPTHWAAVVLVLVESSMRFFLVWKIEYTDLHQVIILFLICMLYIMHMMYFTLSNNPLHAEHRWSCFLVVFSRQKSHNAYVYLLGLNHANVLLFINDLLNRKWNWQAQRYLLGFTLSITTLFIWQVCVIVSFSIHTPISDAVSRLLLKIAQTDCR